MLPTATIIICARNAAAHLRRSVPAALNQDYPRERFKVLVIDNGSEDDTGAVAEELGAIVRVCTRPGVVHARQMGWRLARSTYVAYLDADCEPPVDWLTFLVGVMEGNRKLGAVGAKLVSPSPSTLAERHICESRILDTDRFWERNALQFPFLVTAGMVARRSALQDIGGFDKTFERATGEDADVCWRLERSGWLTEYCPEIEILHHHRSTIPAMLRQIHWYGISSAVLFARWRKELGWWRYTDWGPYRRIGAGLALAVPALIKGRNQYDRLAPTLQVLDAAAFLLGKWRGAIRKGVLFF